MAPPRGASDLANVSLSTVVASVRKDKQRVLVCESFGGQDEPVDGIVSRFVQQGVLPAFPALRIRDQPDERTFQRFEEVGTDLGQLLTSAQKTKAVKASDRDMARAVGRLSSGLYIVTARRGAAVSAMVASWVAPASYEPLGLTIAVADDRAIGSLLQVGDGMVLNVLEQGSSLELMKHFLQRFPAGADRFEGVDWFQSAGCGCPVLRGACAHLECRVVSRIHTGDHWVTYAEVLAGGVARKRAQTAVHHRKVATYY